MNHCTERLEHVHYYPFSIYNLEITLKSLFFTVKAQEDQMAKW
jgi:hypothetical protein